METVFIFKKWTRYTVYGTALFFGLVVVVLFLGLFSKGGVWSGGQWFVLLLGLLIAGTVSVFAWNAYRWRLVFLSDRLRFRAFFWEKEYLFRDLAGYRPNDLNQIKIMGTNGRALVRIPAQSVEHEAVLRHLSLLFPNLDAADQRDELLQFAHTWAERGDHSTDAWGRLAQMQRIAQWVNIGCAVLALILVLLPNVSGFEILLAILLPPAMLAGARYSGGGILAFSRPNSQLPSFGLGMLLTCLSLSFSALFGLNILDPFDLWLPGLVVFLLMLLAMLYGWGNWPGWNKDGLSRLYLTGLFAFMYTLGTVGWLNTLLDGSPLRQSTSTILTKTEERRLWIFTYEFRLDGVEDRAAMPSVNVPKAIFEQYAPYDTVQVYWREGALGAAWVEEVR